MTTPASDDRCKCGQDTHICAPWLYMGPWHDENCWMFGPTPPAEELLGGERYESDTADHADMGEGAPMTEEDYL